MSHFGQQDIAEFAHLPKKCGEFFPLIGKGVFHLRRDLVEIGAGNEAISFQQLEPVGENGIADELQVIFDELEAVVTFLDTEKNVAEPSFTDEVEQFIQAAFFLQEGLIAEVG